MLVISLPNIAQFDSEKMMPLKRNLFLYNIHIWT